MKNITEIIVVNSSEYKTIKKSILSSIVVLSACKYSKGQKIEIKKSWFRLFLYGSIKVEITRINKNIFEKGFRTLNVLIIFKKVKKK